MIQKKDVIKMYDLPTEVKFCKKCTMSNQRPRITFDAQGICSACNYAEYKKQHINWEEREKELEELLKRIKGKDGGYEIVVPASGGKDSGFIAHQLKYKYGMRVLTVTWSPHIYTDIGYKNFQSMINIGGFDNILGTPNGIVHRKLTRLFFETLGDPFQPFIYGQTIFPLQIAVKFKIPLVIYGENAEGEYGGVINSAFKPSRPVTEQKKLGFSGVSPEDLFLQGISKDDLLPYRMPSEEALKAINNEIYFFGYYKQWIPQENYYYCTKYTGFTANSVRTEGTYSKYASLDDRTDGFHYYLSYIKFGIGRATSDSAHEIRDSHLTREEGVQLVKRFDGEFPKKYFKDFLEYCGFSEDYFWEVIDSWRSHHIWKKVNGEWKLRHTVSGDGADD